ncbi:MAG: MarR family transcriptional regulator [Methanomassiliicoccales archaeon]|nr:MarR family transcriptional regulator [Methanomassiliicoccales archaeon]
MRTSRALAVVLIAIGAVLLIVGVLAPSGHFGMMGGGTASYSTTNLLLIVAGIVMTVVGIVLLFVKEESVTVSPSDHPVLAQAPPPVPKGPDLQLEPNEASTTVEEEQARDELVLRLLSGDERVLYKTIADSGGVALQKDIIARTKMSDAKVSRTIDRLVEKGLVKKERYGVTNRISTTTGNKGPP